MLLSDSCPASSRFYPEIQEFVLRNFILLGFEVLVVVSYRVATFQGTDLDT